MTEVLVRAAGHLVPVDKPAQAYALVSNFIRHLDMPFPTDYKSQPGDTPELPDVSGELPDFKPPEEQLHQSHMKIGMIISIAINVVLVAALVVGVVLYYRLKRKIDDFCYNVVDNVSDDILLT